MNQRGSGEKPDFRLISVFIVKKVDAIIVMTFTFLYPFMIKNFIKKIYDFY